jgi:hypothetical protein
MGKSKVPLSAHSRFAPSAAARFFQCPGWLKQSEKFKRDGLIPEEDDSSKAADDGSKVHDAAGFILQSPEFADLSIVKGYTVDYFEKHFQRLLKKSKIKLDKKMIGNLKTYCQFVFSTVLQPSLCSASKSISIKDVILKVEQKVDATHLHPEFHGTLDYGVGIPYHSWHTVDYKNGVSAVKAEGNMQMLTYNFYILKSVGDFPRMCITIYQPNVPRKQPWKSWNITAKDVLKYGEKWRRVVDRAEGKNPKIQAGKECWFCPCRPHCKEANKSKYEKAARIFS